MNIDEPSIKDFVAQENEFKRDLAEVINRHSREGRSNTPDFVLADYLYKCLLAYEIAVMENFNWHKEK